MVGGGRGSQRELADCAAVRSRIGRCSTGPLARRLNADPRSSAAPGYSAARGACERPFGEPRGCATVSSSCLVPRMCPRAGGSRAEHAAAASRRLTPRRAVLFDQGGARPAEGSSARHQVQTAFELGWSTCATVAKETPRPVREWAVRQRCSYARAQRATVGETIASTDTASLNPVKSRRESSPAPRSTRTRTAAMRA